MLNVAGFWLVVTYLTTPIFVFLLAYGVRYAATAIRREYGSQHVPAILKPLDGFITKAENSFTGVLYIVTGLVFQFIVVVIAILDVVLKKMDCSVTERFIQLVSNVANMFAPFLSYLVLPLALIGGYHLLLKLWMVLIGASIKLSRLEESK